MSTPVTDCSFWCGLGNPPGNPYGFTIIVERQVVGRKGELSDIATRFVNGYARGVCGYPR